MIVAVQILIALIVPGMVFVITAYLKSRERMRLLDVILATSQSGTPLAPGVLQALPGVRSIPAPEVDFRRGVFMIAIGAAIAFIGMDIFLAIASQHGDEAIAMGLGVGAVGILPACVGAALVILSREARVAGEA